MTLVLTVLLGVAAGLIGFIPHLFSAKTRPKEPSGEGFSMIAMGMLMTFVSFAVLVAEIAVCRFIAPSHLLVFGISCILSFLFAMVVYTFRLARR